MDGRETPGGLGVAARAEQADEGAVVGGEQRVEHGAGEQLAGGIPAGGPEAGEGAGEEAVGGGREEGEEREAVEGSDLEGRGSVGGG